MAIYGYTYGTLWNIMEHYGRNMAYLFYVYGMKSMEKNYGTYGNIMETLWPYYGRNRIFHNFPYYGKKFYGHTMDEIAFSIIFHTMEKISIVWKIYGVPYPINFHTIYSLRRVIIIALDRSLTWSRFGKCHG